MGKVRLHFFIGNKDFHTIFSDYIPRKGDEVRFYGQIYKIILLVWCYDEDLWPNKVNIKLKKTT
ncbi:hypothetical protein KA005_20850 [bacterium]|nr:hypothetical protein [bacterium]